LSRAGSGAVASSGSTGLFAGRKRSISGHSPRGARCSTSTSTMPNTMTS
jgi:hypothetical protein